MSIEKGVLERACRNYEEDLVLYYYGDLGSEERLRVERHLPSCPACGRFLDDLRRLLPAMANAEEPPPKFWDNYYREMVAKLAEQEERRWSWSRFFSPVRFWAVPAFGTAAVVVLGLGLTLTSGLWNPGGAPKPEGIPQEILADQEKLEFFKSMHLVEFLDQLERQGDAGNASGSSRSS